MAQRGLFITFEGGDGAGKSTQIKLLQAALIRAGHSTVLTFEPGDTPEGMAIRAMFKSGRSYKWSPESQALLMFADRVLHAERVIQPALDAGQIVLCDRFTDSTIAYQHFGAGLSRRLIDDLHEMLLPNLHPNLTIILDVDPKIGLERSAKRLGTTDEDWFEKLDISFHERLRAGYLQIAQDNPARCYVLDATQPQNILAQKILEYAQARLEK